MSNQHLVAADKLRQTFERRDVALKRLLIALQHVDRDRAISIITAFMSIEDLEGLADFQERR